MNSNQNAYSFILENKYTQHFQGRLIKKIMDISKVDVCLHQIPHVEFRVCEITGPDVNIEVALALIKRQIPKANLQKITFTRSPVSGLQINQEVNIRITSFLTPAHFYVQVASYKNFTDLNNMILNMNQQYVGQTNLLEKEELIVQNLCAVYHENNWCRATIVTIQKPGNAVVVRLLDYGTALTVTINNLRKLLPMFKKISFQAVECKLNNLQSPQGGWSQEVWDLMNSISKKPNRIKLKNFDETGALAVDLFLFNPIYNNWTSINAQLINKKYANFITHPLESAGDFEYQISQQDEASSGAIQISIGSEILSGLYKKTNSLPDSRL